MRGLKDHLGAWILQRTLRSHRRPGEDGRIQGERGGGPEESWASGDSGEGWLLGQCPKSPPSWFPSSRGYTLPESTLPLEKKDES